MTFELKTTTLIISTFFLFFSDISAQDWQSIEPPGGQEYLCMHIDTTNEMLYIGTTNGFWYQDIQTGDWISRIEPGWMGRTVWSICANPDSPGTVITGRENAWFKGYMEISYDWGETNEFLYESTGGWVTDIKYSASNSNIFYATTFTDGGSPGELLKSINGGQSWIPVSNDHTALTSIAMSPASANILYISGDALITKSTDGGLNWTTKANGLPPSLGIYEVAMNRVNEDILVCSNDNGLWRSIDGGENWMQCYTESCKRLVFNPVNTSMIAALTFNTSQILLSLDNGKNWINYTSDFPAEEFGKDIDFSKDGSKLYATSYYDIYERELTLVGISSQEITQVEGSLSKIMPNPFKNTVNIELDLPIAQNVSIVIYNINGRKIKTIFQGQLDKGYSLHTWDSSNDDIAKGVYFCNIIAESNSQIRKIIKQ